MAKDPWTDPDPQPGDCDEFLASIDPSDARSVQAHAGSQEARLTRLTRVSGEDAARLDEPAAKRRQRPDELIAGLVRNA